MKSLIDKLKLLSKHLMLLDGVFRNESNYSNRVDYNIYKENLKRFEELAKNKILKSDNLKSSKTDKGTKAFVDEIYGVSDRQMKLADIIEFLFFSRGVYYLFKSNKFIQDRVPVFLELNLRFVNILMIYETLTVDKKLRNALLSNLKPIIKTEVGYSDLVKWKKDVGLSKKDKRYKEDAPNLYFDSLLPKTAGGLWHEILVYCFILKYNIGYIFPLFLSQKLISLRHKLSPPDLIILHNKTYRYYGIEIGNLKERQSGGFMAPSGIPVIPIDTLNARISDRCPTCGRWIGICPKVIRDFSKTDTFDIKPTNEIRCLTECELYTLKEKLNGVCKYMKFKYKNKEWNFAFADGKHHHYHCCLSKKPNMKRKIISRKDYPDLEKLNKLIHKGNIKTEEKEEFIVLQKKLKRKYSFIKTHSVYYSELVTLYNMNSVDMENEIESDDNNDDS